jgi:hypothetical protein
MLSFVLRVQHYDRWTRQTYVLELAAASPCGPMSQYGPLRVAKCSTSLSSIGAIYFVV